MPPGRGRRTPYAEYERAVAAYTAAGGQEAVQRVVTAISRVNRRLDVFYRSQVADLDINSGEWAVLCALVGEGRDAVLTPTQLADHCGVTASTMTHRLDGMVERGLVTRSPDPTNRTRTRVAIASGGSELFRRAVLDAEVVETRVLDPLTPAEQRTLADLLEKLIAALPGR